MIFTILAEFGKKLNMGLGVALV